MPPETFSSSFVSQRARPPEWDDLLARSSRLLAGNQRPQAAAATLLEATDTLTNNQIESNRFYGLSHYALCGLGRLIAQPSTTSWLIPQAAAGMANGHIRLMRAWKQPDVTKGLVLQSIPGPSAGQYVRPLVEAAVKPMPPPVFFLLNGLTVTAGNRVPPKGPVPFDRLPLPPAAYAPQVLEHNGVVDHLQAAMFAGASYVAYHALRARYEQQTGKQAGETAGDFPCLADIVTQDSLKALLTGEHSQDQAKKMSLMRADELLDIDSGAVGYQDGCATLIPQDLPKPPGSLRTMPGIDRLAVINTERLTCPALQIRGLIPVVMDSIPPILWQADEMVRRSRRAR